MGRKKFRQLPAALIVLIDVCLIGLALIGFALFDHAWPREMEADVSDEMLELLRQIQQRQEQEELQDMAEMELGKMEPLWELFPEKFTDGEPFRDGTTYTGRNLSVALRTGEQDSSQYFVMDIYLRNIECLRTAFGQDTYGKGYVEDAVEMAKRHKAIGAVNGDFYFMGSLGTLIRNGEIYRDEIDVTECMLALYRNGTMEVYENGEYSLEEMISDGVWQTWSFGPSLLDENGKANTEFGHENASEHPRTVIGMVERGHYMLIVVDGRQEDSYGMTYAELAELCEKLGLTVAYNLDGGGSTRMVFDGALISSPSEERDISDIVYVTDAY